MNLVMQGMYIGQMVTGLGTTVTLQNISKTTAGLLAVRWKVISSKSKSKVDFIVHWKRPDETTFLHHVFAVLFSVPCYFAFLLVRIAKLYEVVRQFFGANYPPLVQIFSFDNTSGLIGNTEEILIADGRVALGSIFSPVPVWQSEVFIVRNFLRYKQTYTVNSCHIADTQLTVI